MIRLIGILTGSALAVAVLIVALGVPELTPPADQAPDASEPAALEGPVIPREPAPEATADPEPPPPIEVPLEPVGPAEPEAAVSTSQAEIQAPPAPEPATPPDPDTALEDNWYAFWSPFRSRIAAEGFIAELQRTTGLDYRVVKLKPGIYEVAFAYASDADIQDKLTQISAATGLDMSGS